MNLHIKHNSQFTIHHSQLKLSGSKSETNRLLLLQALYPTITLENASNSEDSEVMLDALHPKRKVNNSQVVDVHHAGTAMRFLTAFFAIQEGREVVVTGSNRMKERPIKILVEALQQLGANIKYLDKIGFPPLKIKGKELTEHKITIAANVSSQYISALLLIAPKLNKGLEVTLEGEITSMPYITMTLALLNQIGVTTSFNNNCITVKPLSTIQKQALNEKSESNSHFIIESDWSSASYFYSIVALSKMDTQISLSNFKFNSLQGDVALVQIYEHFGVETTFTTTGIQLKKVKYVANYFQYNFTSCPDLAQTLAVTCFGLGVGCNLTGLHTLKIKETDRLVALEKELSKLGAFVITSDDSLKIGASTRINPNCSLKTYQDHRMAMAFAPLALKVPLLIQDAEVVAKSYPNFWKDLADIGFQVTEAH